MVAVVLGPEPVRTPDWLSFVQPAAQFVFDPGANAPRYETATGAPPAVEVALPISGEFDAGTGLIAVRTLLPFRV